MRGRGAPGREGTEGLGDGFAAAGATGLLGIDGAAGLDAFWTERIAFPGAGWQEQTQLHSHLALKGFGFCRLLYR